MTSSWDFGSNCLGGRNGVNKGLAWGKDGEEGVSSKETIPFPSHLFPTLMLG
jgi:hypothetical protein